MAALSHLISVSRDPHCLCYLDMIYVKDGCVPPLVNTRTCFALYSLAERLTYLFCLFEIIAPESEAASPRNGDAPKLFSLALRQPAINISSLTVLVLTILHTNDVKCDRSAG